MERSGKVKESKGKWILEISMVKFFDRWDKKERKRERETKRVSIDEATE